MSDPSPVRMTLKIENVYEDGEEVTLFKDIDVPAPPNHDIESEAHEDWAEEHLFAETGTGRFAGNGTDEKTPDAAYFVRIVECDQDPTLVGNDYEWGL